ncbi:MAG: gamma-glutamyltransferase, partial [Polyangiales bacterium]
RMASAKAGTPPGTKAERFYDGHSPELPSTSHFSIVDGAGDIVSMTTSVENPFGSRVVVRGIILNNQLTDFSFRPERDGKPVANAVAAHKRPPSSMSPVVIFDAQSGAPVAAIGSPGGSRIISYVARAAIGLMDFDLDPQAATELPHVINRGGTTELEERGWPDGRLEAVQSYLEDLGHEVAIVELISGLHGISLGDDEVLGGADPRREGLADGTADSR